MEPCAVEEYLFKEVLAVQLAAPRMQHSTKISKVRLELTEPSLRCENGAHVEHDEADSYSIIGSILF